MRCGILLLLVLGGLGCASSSAEPRLDGALVVADAGPGVEAGALDGQLTDGALPDGALQPDAAPCAIAQGQTPTLDGTGDYSEYLASQHLAVGAPQGSTDVAAITWDPSHLYVTMTSDAFGGAFEPLHIYVEARATTLPAAVASTGKEYGGLTPALPFTPTHVIAVRRQTDSGTGGPYDGVYTPAAAWATRSLALEPGTHVFASTDLRTLSVRAPWSALGGCPTRLRLAAHVVHNVVANEWKDTVPPSHTPWLAPGGGSYEIDLTASPAVAGWTLR